MKKLASLIVVVATIAAAFTIVNQAHAAAGVSVSVNATNGAVVAPTNVPVKFTGKGVQLDTGVYVLSTAGTSPTNNNLVAPYTNAPNGSLCVTTNGQLWIRTNNTWTPK